MLAVTSLLGTNFEGVDQLTSGFIPPDTYGAVGPSHIVQMMNGRVRITTKSGSPLSTPFDKTLAAFWKDIGITGPETFFFDPRVEFDPVSSRWFACAAVDLTATNNRVLFAVSAGSDPTGVWKSFAIDSDSNDDQAVDYPRFGFDGQGVYLIATMVNPIAIGSAGTHLWVLPKADLLAATPSVSNLTRFENIFGGPGDRLRASPEVLPVVAPNGGIATGLILATARNEAAHLTGPINSPTLVVNSVVGVTGVKPDYQEVIPQPNNAPNLDTNPIGSVARSVNGKVYYTNTYQATASVGLRVVELDNDGDFLRQGELVDSRLSFNTPSLAISPTGDFVVGMTGSSADVNIAGTSFVGYPSAYAVAGRFSSTQIEFGGQLTQLRAGGGAKTILQNGRNRWGDYTQTVLDPVDPNRFWTFQQFERTQDVYSTQISQVTVNLATPGAPDLVAASDTGLFATDNITRERLPTFTGVAQPNVTVTLFVDSTQIPSVTSDAQGNWTVTMPGLLDEGYRVVYAKASYGTLLSGNSPSLQVDIDVTGPSVLGWSPVFDVETLPHKLRVTTLPGDAVSMPSVSVLNRSTNTAQAFTIQQAGSETQVVFPGRLADAFYRSTHAFADLAGNESLATYQFAWLWCDTQGDANLEARFDEFLIVAQNYGMSGMTYSQGNFNYDPLGLVDFDDLLLISQRFNLNLDTLAPPIV